MTVSRQQPPTQRQLRYLRVLATSTATTFVSPRTRGQASREIERLRSLGDAPRMQAHDGDRVDVELEHLSYATAVHPDEVTGYGSSATWRAGSGGPVSLKPTRMPPKAPAELARYTVSAGERVLYGERVGGCIRVTDRPGCSGGRSYLVERQPELDGQAALRALIADYLEQARELDDVPMASGAVHQLIAPAGNDA